MRQAFSEFRNNMIDFRRRFNNIYTQDVVDITNEINIPPLFQDVKITALMNKSKTQINKIIFYNIPCHLGDSIKKGLVQGQYFYETQGIRTTYQHIHHPHLIMKIKDIKWDRASMSKICATYDFICPICEGKLNNHDQVINIGKWMNINNMNTYKQLFQNQTFPIPEELNTLTHEGINLDNLNNFAVNKISELFEQNKLDGDILN